MLAESNFKGPIDVEIINKKNGSKRILLNNFDVSMITTKHEIRSVPGSLDELIIVIPIGHLVIRDE